MLVNQQRNNLAKMLASGLFLVSIVVALGGLTDPVNVPKFVILGVYSSTILGLLISFGFHTFKEGSRILVLVLSLFLVFSIVSVARSVSPFTQNIYGAFGRNNGLLTYLFLSILLFSASLLRDRLSNYRILKSLVYAGYVNLAYCLWVILFGDFIPWNNQYGEILGTFGNPNFIGAFLGILFGVLLAFGLGHDSSKKFKIALIFLLPLTVFEIVTSKAIQGRVLAALSIGIVGVFYLYFKLSKKITFLFALGCVIIGALATAGAFQQGPLANLIYKTSVSLRGQYWLAAWNTGQANPISGVGMDSFGDWYRRARDLRAIELPGTNVVVNTAHNVPLDMFAFGGWPLFISYLLIMLISLRALIIIAKNMQSYDSVGVALITAWTCYQVQSIISINQIGLAIWGWVLSGSLIAYSKLTPEARVLPEKQAISRKPGNSGVNQLKPTSLLSASIFGLIGLLISLPPLAADIKLRSALVSQNAQRLEETMNSGFFNPQNSQKFIVSIQAFEASGLYDLSYKYAKQAVAWNPNSFDFWRILYLIKNSTEQEKMAAIQRMKNLDPLNPDVTATQ